MTRRDRDHDQDVRHHPTESQRQSSAVDSSFASVELRALLNRELVSSPLSSGSSPPAGSGGGGPRGDGSMRDDIPSPPSGARDGDEHWALFDYNAVRSVSHVRDQSSSSMVSLSWFLM